MDYYLFTWGKEQVSACFVLGLGSLNNHSAVPNTAARCINDEERMEFVALRDISEGEQVFIDYQWDEAEYHFSH